MAARSLGVGKGVQKVVAGLPARTLSVLWLLVAAGACHCGKDNGGSGLVGTGGVPAVSSPVNFGNVNVGSTVTLKLTLRNVGASPLRITSQQVAGSGFAEKANFNSTVPPGGSSTASLSFTPTQAGPATGTLTINDDGTPNKVVVQLLGNGVDLALSVTPSSLDFGQVPVGISPAPTQTVTFQNNNTAAVYLSASSAGIAPEFTVTGSVVSPTPVQLAAGASTQATVAFEPDQVQTFNSSFSYTVCEDAAGKTCLAPQQVSLTGQGISGEVTLSPSPIVFSSVPLDSTAQQTVTVTNTGTDDVVVSCIYLESLGASACGTASSEFSLGTPSAALPATLTASGGNLNFVLSYDATDGGMDTVAVVYQPAGLTTTQTATDVISASSSSSPCQITVTPSAVNFGSASVGSAVSQTVTVANGGQEGCTVSGIAIDPTSDPSYALAAGQATSLTLTAAGSPGASADIGLTFDLNNGNPPANRTGQLDFGTTDPTHASVAVPLTAQVAAPTSCGSQTDTFSTPAGAPQLDMVWMIDNDDDAEETGRTTLLAGVPQIMAAAFDAGVDFRMVVMDDSICTDQGAFLPCPGCIENPGPTMQIITPADADPTTELETALNVPDNEEDDSSCVPTDGGIGVFAGDEQILSSLFAGFQPAILSGHNSGFLRPAAHLAIIAVNSDGEDDNSAPSLNYYYAFLESLKSNPALLTFSYVNYGLDEVGLGAFQRLSQLVSLTGGVEADTSTTAWLQAFSGVWAASTVSGYDLSKPPVASTITVSVNGTPYPASEWSYNPGTNGINFNPVPAGGSTISVSYAVPCCLPQCTLGSVCAGQSDGCGGTCPITSCQGCCGGSPIGCVSLCAQIPGQEASGLCGTGWDGGACTTCGTGNVCYYGSCQPNDECDPPCTGGQACYEGYCYPTTCDPACTGGTVCELGTCEPAADCAIFAEEGGL